MFFQSKSWPRWDVGDFGASNTSPACAVTTTPALLCIPGRLLINYPTGCQSKNGLEAALKCPWAHLYTYTCTPSHRYACMYGYAGFRRYINSKANLLYRNDVRSKDPLSCPREHNFIRWGKRMVLPLPVSSSFISTPRWTLYNPLSLRRLNVKCSWRFNLSFAWPAEKIKISQDFGLNYDLYVINRHIVYCQLFKATRRGFGSHFHC